MARKKVRRGKKNKALPISIIAPLAMPAMVYSLPKFMAGDVKGGVQSLAQEYTGINPDGSFNGKQIIQWALPTAVGYVVHKGANRFGVNKYARKLTMGFLEI